MNGCSGFVVGIYFFLYEIILMLFSNEVKSNFIDL